MKHQPSKAKHPASRIQIALQGWASLPSGHLPWAWMILLIAVLGFGACKTSPTEAEAPAGLEVRLDAVPLLLKADTLEYSTIWATVLEEGDPIADSTRVSFATTNGTIAAEAFTIDGLAQANFVPGLEVGIASIIAQVKTIRDTVLITLY